MVITVVYCPHCGSEEIVRNGKAPNGKQKYRCKACKKQSREHCQVPEKLNIKVRVNKEQSASHALGHSDQATDDLTLRVVGLDYKN